MLPRKCRSKTLAYRLVEACSAQLCAFALESQPSAVDTWVALKSSTSTSREDLIYKSVPIYFIQPLRRNRLGLGTNKIRRFSASSRKVPVPRGIECIREEPNKLVKPEKMGAVQATELYIQAALSVNEEVFWSTSHQPQRQIQLAAMLQRLLLVRQKVCFTSKGTRFPYRSGL